MKWIQQDASTKLCGQIAVAVIANITVEKSVELFGKKGSTRTKDVVRVLRGLGYTCPDRLSRKRLPNQNVGIAKVTYAGNRNCGHWVVLNETQIFDGIYGTPDGRVKWPDGARMTSYLPITKLPGV